MEAVEIPRPDKLGTEVVLVALSAPWGESSVM